MSNSRETSYTALYNVLYNGAYSNIEINRLIKASKLDRRDSALAVAIFYGVLERKITLDRIIEQYSKIPIRKIENKVLIILEQAIYQILYLNKIPDSAAVNEAVDLAKRLRLNKSSGFVNGILRSFLRNSKKYAVPDMGKDRIGYLSFEYSCPKEIINVFDKSYGKKNTEQLLKSFLGKPPLTVAVNTIKTNKTELVEQLEKCGVRALPSGFAKNSLTLFNTGSLEALSSFKNGDFYVQDEASQLAVELLSPKSGERIVDVCAAPGGKSFKFALLMQNEGEIFSYDIYPHKVELIQKTASRLGITIINASVRDALDEHSIECADKVICDVPCSGFGAIRRKPDIKYKNFQDFSHLPDLQYKILLSSSRIVKKGGVLLYSTCTLNRTENNDVVKRFIAKNKDFRPFPLQLPDGLKRVTDEEDNCLTLFPGIYGTDGFFLSMFIRCE